MAAALWLYGLAMFILARTMGGVELALACHMSAVVAVVKGWRAGMPAEWLVLWMFWSMMLSAVGQGVFKSIWYVWQKVNDRKKQ